VIKKTSIKFNFIISTFAYYTIIPIHIREIIIIIIVALAIGTGKQHDSGGVYRPKILYKYGRHGVNKIIHIYNIYVWQVRLRCII